MALTLPRPQYVNPARGNVPVQPDQFPVKTDVVILNDPTLNVPSVLLPGNFDWLYIARLQTLPISNFIEYVDGDLPIQVELLGNGDSSKGYALMYEGDVIARPDYVNVSITSVNSAWTKLTIIRGKGAFDPNRNLKNIIPERLITSPTMVASPQQAGTGVTAGGHYEDLAGNVALFDIVTGAQNTKGLMVRAASMCARGDGMLTYGRAQLVARFHTGSPALLFNLCDALCDGAITGLAFAQMQRSIVVPEGFALSYFSTPNSRGSVEYEPL